MIILQLQLKSEKYALNLNISSDNVMFQILSYLIRGFWTLKAEGNLCEAWCSLKFVCT